MKTRKLKSLGLDEAIKVNTLAQAEWFIKKLYWDDVKPQQLVGNYICQEYKGYFVWTDFLSCSTEYPASDFIKPKKSKFKTLEKRVEALENFIYSSEQQRGKSTQEGGNYNKGFEALEKSIDQVNKTKLQVGKWYKSKTPENPYILFIESKEENKFTSYGISSDGNWINREASPLFIENYINDGLIEATPEEVESALIKEAEKIGFKEGVKVDRSMLPSPINEPVELSIGKTNYRYFQNDNLLDFNGYAIFHNGKWAEIVPNEEETIDWSKAGQLVELKDHKPKVIMLTTGSYNIDANCFSGIVVQEDKIFRFGEYSKHWGMSDFKPFKGELILKN